MYYAYIGEAEVAIIHEAMGWIESQSCVKFTQKTVESTWLRIQNIEGYGCWSSVSIPMALYVLR